jgi:hypothetical protein
MAMKMMKLVHENENGRKRKHSLKEIGHIVYDIAMDYIFANCDRIGRIKIEPLKFFN